MSVIQQALPGVPGWLSRKYVPRRPVLVGALITAVVTHVLVAAPELVEFTSFRRELSSLTGIWLLDNPFTIVGFLGGIVGGYVAGYMTQGGLWRSNANGIQSVLLGVGLFYVTVVSWSVLNLLAVGGLTLSILLIVLFKPLVFLVVPMSLLYIFQSIPSSVIGKLAATVINTRISSKTVPEEVTQFEVGVYRIFVGTLVCVALFAIAWGLSFYLTAGLFTYRL